MRIGAVVWTLILLPFNYFSIAALVCQGGTIFFAVASGTLRECKVVALPNPKGDLYEVQVAFEYDIRGQTYRGTTRRYLTWPFLDQRSATQACRDFKVGKPVLVYYNPFHPVHAVLIRGLEPSDLFYSLCLTPFNTALMLSWVVVWGTIRTPSIHRPVLLTRLKQDFHAIKLELFETSPAIMAILVRAAVSAVMVLFAAVGMFALSQQWSVYVGWIVVILCSLWGFWLCRFPQLTVQIEPLLFRIAVFNGNGRSALQSPIGNLLRVELLQTITEKESGGIVRAHSEAFETRLVYRSPDTGEDQTLKLVEWANESAARWLVGWLREKLSLPEAHRVSVVSPIVSS